MRLRCSGWRRCSVLALGCLLRDAEHGADLGPGPVSSPGSADGFGEIGVDLVSLPGEFGDVAQRVGVGLVEVGWVDGVGPGLEGCGPFCSALGHGLHHPVRNLGRAGIAWITAVP